MLSLPLRKYFTLSSSFQLSETQLSYLSPKVSFVQDTTAIKPLKEICDEKDSNRCNRSSRCISS
ncbi:conserved hypothetical protein [Vibrio aestuarianus]|uniref:Uncharacterized protein n=1 Tax=Vibrio aestuarianus TaxID=28171 RepID=A0ABN8TJP4_9VIBR|nr:conserved hypothetical protein [Vibrio aestuarianus]CAH8220604.1 conserved hypothetical protein [Vibrio aestuarianus]CAH8225317.1 conserved hypothetical protein [Vibrio aestuarianus]CAH8225333.1 conserved hypothetical protein [Vibrio aestuarianus]CAH8225369.1 conserved hypothetical protein [Vibrio aestuarianus]